MNETMTKMLSTQETDGTMSETMTRKGSRAMSVTMTKTLSNQEPDRTMSEMMTRLRSTRGAATCMRAGERG